MYLDIVVHPMYEIYDISLFHFINLLQIFYINYDIVALLNVDRSSKYWAIHTTEG